MILNADDILHEIQINDAERNMKKAFDDKNINVAHGYANEFARLIQRRSAQMVEFMESKQSFINQITLHQIDQNIAHQKNKQTQIQYSSCVENRRMGDR